VESSAACLVGISLSDALLASYPHLPSLIGADATIPLLKSLLSGYTHVQRGDANVMASAPMLAKGGTLGGGGASSRRSSSRQMSKGGSTKRRSSGEKTRGGALSTVAEDSVVQPSRVSSVRSARSGGSSDAGGATRGGGAGLSEKALLERQCSTPVAGGSIAGGSQAMGASCTGRSSVSGGGGDGAERRSVDGRASCTGTMASMAASSAGTALSEASRGEPPFVDPVAKVQRLQRSRLHGRFQREARVARRWDELKGLAITMQQQEQQQQKYGVAR